MTKGIYYSLIYALLLCSSFSALAEDDTFTTSYFSGSGNCAKCHDGLTDTSGKNVSIAQDWGSSMMANSTKDPFWRAKVASELNRNPQLSTLINDKCSKCHAPMAHFELTKVQGREITLFGPDGLLDPGHSLYDAGMNGVSCTLCHQIKDDPSLGELAGFSGHYIINDNKTIYGQFREILPDQMIMKSDYTPEFSEHISDSEMCATCHELKTSFVDADGNIVKTTPETEFPEQMPYTEWENSIFDGGSNPQSCQDCHMPKTTSKVSNIPLQLDSKTGFAKHELVGANTVMLTLLRDSAEQLDVISPNMDLAISRARAMLQSSVSMSISSVSVTNGIFEFQLNIENNSGHKTPTGYPSRRMWLHFKVTDASNNVVFESGSINADGSIVGADNDTDQKLYEPHYNLITAADQVQIYEPVMGDTDGNVTFTLLRGARYLKDNRLTPKGFNKHKVPSDVAVRGLAMDDVDFNLGRDGITYRFPVTATGDLNISVSLNYQIIGYGFVQDLYRDNQLKQVKTFKSLYDAQTLKHEQVTRVQTTIFNNGDIPPPMPVVSLSESPS